METGEQSSHVLSSLGREGGRESKVTASFQNRSLRSPQVLYAYVCVSHLTCTVMGCLFGDQFRMMIPSLASVGTVVTYDVYGCGESPKPNQPEAYSTEVSH